MLGQINMQGNDLVETAIDRIRTFEPKDGYYIAFSGGKDSVVIKALADMAGVKYDAHYNVTTVDPPELIKFMKKYHKDVKFEKATYRDGRQVTMWNLIPKKRMPPTRRVRYCCEFLKEGGGEGRFVMTGVRWAESQRRRNSRAGLEIDAGDKRHRELLDPDNPQNSKMVNACAIKHQRTLNPIIDWGDSDIWEFIHSYNIPYCELYDKGHKRLGCIGCPLARSKTQKKELNEYPQFKKMYLKAFENMLKEREKNGLETEWKTPQEVMEWWTSH